MTSTTNRRANSSTTKRASSTRRMAPRPATDPKRWNAITGGRSIRRQPKPSNLQKALGMLPIGKKAATAKSSGSRGGTAGKAAMLTAAAGIAYKNRDKIAALLSKRNEQSSHSQPVTTTTTPPPVNPA